MQNQSQIASSQKSVRLNIRASLEQKEALLKAAEINHTTLSNFILENACLAAHETIADKVDFHLSDKEWESFCKALDAPPKDIISLKTLLSESGVFDAK